MDMDDTLRQRESDDYIEEKQDNEGQLELDLEPDVTYDDNTPKPEVTPDEANQQWTLRFSGIKLTETMNGGE